MVLPLLIGILLGGIVGVIAEQKNRPFFPWATYGFFFFFFAIIHIAIIGDKAYEDRQLAGMGYKKCPACAQMVKSEAIICEHCKTSLGDPAAPEPEGSIQKTAQLCRWCKQAYKGAYSNKCPSCGGLQKHFLKDNPLLLVLIFCLMIAFLVVFSQVNNEGLQTLPSSEEFSAF